MQLVKNFLDAAERGDLITVDRLLRGGLPVDVSDGYDWTALQLATLSNRTDVIKRLVYEGADVNRQDRYKATPLHYATRYNNNEVAQLLWDNGADINLKNNRNKTPLVEARKGSEIESLLLQLQQSVP